MKLLPKTYYAVTINPLTKHRFLRRPDTIVRYDQMGPIEQTTILQEMLDKLNESHDVLDVGFERTKAQNYHVHFSLHILTEKPIFEKNIQSLLDLSPREIVIKEIYSPQWAEYALKEQPQKTHGFLF